MKIIKIENIPFKSIPQNTFAAFNVNMGDLTSNLSAQTPKQTPKKNKILATIAILGATVIAGVMIYKSKSLKGIKDKGEVLDVKFKDSILNALKNEGISCKKNALNSIVGPEEFSQLINKYEYQDFQRCIQGIIPEFKTKGAYEAYLKVNGGTLPPKELEKYYKPLLDGKFRASLHTHSNHSDGSASVEEFLESALLYANKVARQNLNDSKPPFIVALTDHDNIDGCREAIKIIAQNPVKYKNLKFVAGCEFSVKSDAFVGGKNYFDLTGLALNPFDEKLVNLMENLKNTRQKSVEKFLEDFLSEDGKKYSFEDLVRYQKESNFKNGKRTIENRAGVVSVRHAIEALERITGTKLTKQKKYLGEKDILPIDTIIKATQENGGFTSLTHPMKSFYKYVGDTELNMLKKQGVKGIEAYHQYTPSKYYALGGDNVNENAVEILRKYEDFAHKNDMFISGGTDSHKKQIFSRDPIITDDLLRKIIS